MVYNAARMKDAGVNFVKEAAMTKLFTSQVAERVTSLAIEVYGGYGFTKDYPVENIGATPRSAKSTKARRHAAGHNREAGDVKVTRSEVRGQIAEVKVGAIRGFYLCNLTSHL